MPLFLFLQNEMKNNDKNTKKLHNNKARAAVATLLLSNEYPTLEAFSTNSSDQQNETSKRKRRKERENKKNKPTAMTTQHTLI
jgi:hypothetical protein